MKRLIAITAAVVATTLALIALWQMREAVVLLLLGLAIAAAFDPVVRRVGRWRFGRSMAITLVYLIAIGFVAITAFTIGTLVSGEISLILEQVPRWYDQWLIGLSLRIDGLSQLPALLPSSGVLATSLADQNLGLLGEVLLGILIRITAVTAIIVGAAALSFFWLNNQNAFANAPLTFLPLRQRVIVRDLGQQLYTEVGYYVREEVMRVALIFLSLLGIYGMLQIPGATLLAALGGIAIVVPILGPGLAILPGVAVGFAQGGVSGWLTLILAASVMGIAVFLIMRRRTRRSSTISVQPVLVVVLIWVLADLGGPFFVLLARPTAATIQVIFRSISQGRTSARLQSDPLQPADVVQLRQDLEVLEVAIKSGDAAPEIVQLANRVRELLHAAEQAAEPPADNVQAVGEYAATGSS
ncbi:MAG: AI-2E family transporter [Oscillochloris sp.]|nr:AI-2E family transporter [Oscillochloris sp.]